MAARKTATVTKKSEEDILKSAMERVAREQGVEAEVEEDEVKVAAPVTSKNKRVAAPTPTGETVPRSKAKSAKIAYTPLVSEDPSFTIFFGMKFEANVEREVTNPECIKLATQNPWFKVDGKHHAKRATPPKREVDENAVRSGLPDGADPEKVEIEASETDFV